MSEDIPRRDMYDLMMETHATSARVEQHCADLDTAMGEIGADVSRLVRTMPGIDARLAVIESKCGPCDALELVQEFAAERRGRQDTLAEIVPVRSARIGGRAVIVGAFVAGLLALVSAIGGPWLAWHLATRTAQAHTLHAPP